MKRQINKTLELTYDEVRALPAFVFQRRTPAATVEQELSRLGWTMALPGPSDPQAGIRDLASQAGQDLQVGDDVAVYSRGSFRLARIVRVGRTKLHVAYVTPGGIDEAARRIVPYIIGRSDEQIRSYAERIFTESAGWTDAAARTEKIENYIADAVAERELVRREGWAAVASVTVYQAKPDEIKAFKVNAASPEELE